MTYEPLTNWHPKSFGINVFDVTFLWQTAARISVGVRKKHPPEETPFPINSIAEETPFHILHTRKKHPR
ncbi:hypothetical protein DPMN_154264 [Dreissena polymorpha]|uniref:Uncharacterized protein n=1 Tax=Dreissena polymorpha TaxID=45954 RepID=A0A9D4FMA3_DREPO|nr:hypothetical protein DPMN_154264 [Dreissena polymorpha]